MLRATASSTGFPLAAADGGGGSDEVAVFTWKNLQMDSIYERTVGPRSVECEIGFILTARRVRLKTCQPAFCHQALEC